MASGLRTGATTAAELSTGAVMVTETAEAGAMVEEWRETGAERLTKAGTDDGSVRLDRE